MGVPLSVCVCMYVSIPLSQPGLNLPVPGPARIAPQGRAAVGLAHLPGSSLLLLQAPAGRGDPRLVGLPSEAGEVGTVQGTGTHTSHTHHRLGACTGALPRPRPMPWRWPGQREDI